MRKQTLHRDAPLELANPPRFDTSSPLLTNWRTDLTEVAVASAVIAVAGFFLTLTACALRPAWDTLGVGLWLTALFALAPFGLLAYMNIRKLTDRHSLSRTRVEAEQRMLLGAWLDTDQDGTLEDDELDAFLRYARMLYHGASTTAAQAQSMGYPGPTWQKYRNALISLGYGVAERKRGGTGFTLRPSIRSQPWPKLEADIRQRAGMLVRDGTSPGVLITTSAPPPSKRLQVSTLPGDLFDPANTDND